MSNLIQSHLMTGCFNLFPQKPQGTDLATSNPSTYFFHAGTIHFEKPKSLCQVLYTSFFWEVIIITFFYFYFFFLFQSRFPKSGHILLWSKTMGLLLLPLLYTCLIDCFRRRWKDFDKWRQLEMVRWRTHCWLCNDTSRCLQRWSKFQQCTQVFLGLIIRGAVRAACR